VIRGNIERSFPERSEADHRQIERLYYRHFADITLESIKNFSISDAEARSRMQHEHLDVFQPFFQAGRSVLIAGGHFNNWELYAMTANQNLPHDVMAVYKRLSNSTMDEAVRESRQRFGLEMVRTVDSQAWMDAHVNGERPKAVVMGFDQSPADPLKSWWNTFLHQETAWYFGLEKWARMYDLPVIYGHIKKLKRGRYETHYELVTDSPNALPEGAILQRCIDLLEADIRETPHQWLWSHKRWKHARPESMPLNPRPEPETQPVDHA
jgi:KDO2-lipid IV(A) lauroyltransferase